MQVVNVKYVERSLSMDGTIMRGTYTYKQIQKDTEIQKTERDNLKGYCVDRLNLHLNY